MPDAKKTSPNSERPFARVALPLPMATCFTYRIPDDLTGEIFVGRRVEVPFGRRSLSGFVVELSTTSDVAKIKPIKAVLDTYLSENLLRLAAWMASYYGCSLGEAAQAALPSSLKRLSRKARLEGTVRLTAGRETSGDVREILEKAPRQLELALRLIREGGEADFETVTKEWEFSPVHVRALIDKGIAEQVGETGRSPLETIETPVTRLNPDQQLALDRVTDAVSAGRFAPILLHGVTSSGKTEIYLRSAEFVLSKGGGCIVLVPEIGLLPQAVARYKRVFGGDMAVIHSRLTGGERFEIWRRVERGECRLVLGPRSAIFSPIKNVKLIIVDEEQDDSYKQGDKPRYHARNVALMRGKFENLTVLLGSATPSAESLHHALGGRYSYLRLPERIGGYPFPRVRVVDMRREIVEGAFCSPYLLERLESTVRKGRQSILFLNKRGHARFVQCNACGWVARCKNCDIALIFHRVSNRLKCHFCGYHRASVKRCDECGSSRLFFAGAGTQRVELDLASLLPGVGILRMDADTTAGKEGHKKVLEKFSTGRYAILIGTQMVAKGHHFPRVDLVGVLYAEDSLNYPDFRSSERTFQQLVQVAGRAGRAGSDSEVVVQTFSPDHYVFEYLKSYDYEGFMTKELAIRKQLEYPPFSRIALASCSSHNKTVLHRVVERWVDTMRREHSGAPIDILGPVPPLVERVKNRYREHVLIKGHLTVSVKDELLETYRRTVDDERGGSSVDLRWDVDPQSFF